MAQFDKPLVGIVGVVGRDPEIKTTSKGPLTKFSVAVSDGFGEGAKTTWFNVAIFNEGLQDWAQNNVYKGAQVAVQGTVTEKEGYGPDMLAVRVGLVTWGQRSKLGQSAPVQQSSQDDADF